MLKKLKERWAAFYRKNGVVKNASEVTLTLADSAVTIFTQVSPLQIGTSFRNAYSNIKAEIFNEKLQSFLQETQELKKEETNKFLILLSNDKEEFFKRLFIVIDRIDEKDKSKMLGKLFKSLVQGKVQSEDFLQLTSMIEKTYIEDLKYLIKRYSPQMLSIKTLEKPFYVNEEIEKTLSSIGFVTEGITLERDDVRKPQFTYQISSFGKMLVENCV